MKKAIYHIINALSVLIIAVSLFILLSVVMTKPGQAPQVFGFSAFRVLTGSMEPSVPQNALLLVRQTPAEALQIGDVITFYSSDPALHGSVNTHRIVEIGEGENHQPLFQTQGDANPIPDKFPVAPEQLIGKMVFLSPFLGRVCGLVSNPLVFIPIVFLPLLLILLSNMWKTIRLAREAVQQEEAALLQPEETAQPEPKQNKKTHKKR